jgi:hypothetical protein
VELGSALTFFFFFIFAKRQGEVAQSCLEKRQSDGTTDEPDFTTGPARLQPCEDLSIDGMT